MCSLPFNRRCGRDWSDVVWLVRVTGRIERKGDNTIIAPPHLSIVASEITNQRKVEFPAMAKFYWQDWENMNPADFVRASLSIPLFYEPFSVTITAYPKDEEGQMLLQLPEYQHRTRFAPTVRCGSLLTPPAQADPPTR